jgi:hypothetical protein
MRRAQRKRERQKGSDVFEKTFLKLWKARSIGTDLASLVTENFPRIRSAPGAQRADAPVPEVCRARAEIKRYRTQASVVRV